MATLAYVLLVFAFRSGFADMHISECLHLQGICICDESSVVCNGHQQEQIHEIVVGEIKNRRKNIETVNLTNYHLEELPLNILGSCQQSTENQYPKLVTLNLSNNGITTIHGQTFHCMPELKTLILSHNQWFVNGTTHTGVFSNLYSLTELDLTNAFHEMINGTIHIINFPKFLSDDMTALRILKLGGNEFRVFPKAAGDSLCHLMLEHLDLSHNELMGIGGSIGLSDCMKQIKSIDLSYNRLTTLSKTTRDTFESLHKNPTADPEIFLESNQWNCDCTITDFRNWLKTTHVKIQDRNSFTCQGGYPTSNKDELLMDIDQSKLQCPVPSTKNSTGLRAFYVVMGIIFALTACIVIAVAYVKRAALKDLFVRLTKPIRGGLTSNAQYGYFTVQHEQV